MVENGDDHPGGEVLVSQRLLGADVPMWPGEPRRVETGQLRRLRGTEPGSVLPTQGVLLRG